MAERNRRRDSSPRLRTRPVARQPDGPPARWEPVPPAGGRAAISWLLPATGNPLPQLMALAPWRQSGDEVVLLGVEPDPSATWAPLVDQTTAETGPAAGRLAWGRIVVSLPAGRRWPDSLREMVLAGAEAASWGFCNRRAAPAWLVAMGSALDPRRPTASRLAGRALFWRADEASRVSQLADLPYLGPPARLPVAVRSASPQASALVLPPRP